jgi:hypothetical protein
LCKVDVQRIDLRLVPSRQLEISGTRLRPRRLRVACPNTASAQCVAPDDRQRRALLPTSGGCWDRWRRPRCCGAPARIRDAGAGLDRMFAAFDATSQRTAQMPALDTITAIAAQYGVVIHPPAEQGTKGATTAPAPADLRTTLVRPASLISSELCTRAAVGPLSLPLVTRTAVSPYIHPGSRDFSGGRLFLRNIFVGCVLKGQDARKPLPLVRAFRNRTLKATRYPPAVWPFLMAGPQANLARGT